MDEIMKLVARRNMERKTLSTKDVKRICNIIINGKNYNDYVHDIHFKKTYDKDELAAGMYNGEELFFFADGLDNFVDVNMENIDSNMDGTRVDFTNYFILVTIFHELAHVRQNVMQDYRLNKEGQLYTICEKLSGVDNFYGENYKYDLREINAWALGFLNACEIYANLPGNLISQYDMSIYKNFAISKILSNYSTNGEHEIVFSPSEKLFKNADKYNLANIGVNREKFNNLIHMGDNFTLYRKLCIGLPISFDALSFMHMLLICSNSGEQFSFVKKMQSRK